MERGELSRATRSLRLVYAELRRQAQLVMRREDEGHTLQPTALVHEAWLRLGDQHDVRWESRSQFFAIAAQMMRRVLLGPRPRAPRPQARRRRRPGFAR